MITVVERTERSRFGSDVASMRHCTSCLVLAKRVEDRRLPSHDFGDMQRIASPQLVPRDVQADALVATGMLSPAAFVGEHVSRRGARCHPADLGDTIRDPSGAPFRCIAERGVVQAGPKRVKPRVWSTCSRPSLASCARSRPPCVQPSFWRHNSWPIVLCSCTASCPVVLAAFVGHHCAVYGRRL